jgi:hypothetical protein
MRGRAPTLRGRNDEDPRISLLAGGVLRAVLSDRRELSVSQFRVDLETERVPEVHHQRAWHLTAPDRNQEELGIPHEEGRRLGDQAIRLHVGGRTGTRSDQVAKRQAQVALPLRRYT